MSIPFGHHSLTGLEASRSPRGDDASSDAISCSKRHGSRWRTSPVGRCGTIGTTSSARPPSLRAIRRPRHHRALRPTAHIRGRRGLPKAIGATRHDLLILYWYLLRAATRGNCP